MYFRFKRGSSRSSELRARSFLAYPTNVMSMHVARSCSRFWLSSGRRFAGPGLWWHLLCFEACNLETALCKYQHVEILVFVLPPLDIAELGRRRGCFNVSWRLSFKCVCLALILLADALLFQRHDIWKTWPTSAPVLFSLDSHYSHPRSMSSVCMRALVKHIVP